MPHRQFIVAARENNFPTLFSTYVFHKQDIDVNGRDQWGYPALFYAMNHRNARMIKLLTDSGADIFLECIVNGVRITLYQYAVLRQIQSMLPQNRLPQRRSSQITRCSDKRRSSFYQGTLLRQP